MNFNSGMRIAEHPARADKSALGALMYFQKLNWIMKSAYTLHWFLL
jgi:hypothetical protein